MDESVEASDFGRESWERRWTKVLSAGVEHVDQRPPNRELIAEVSSLQPGRALDAGSGHGAESLWLAAKGWEVDAVDFSATALEHARSRAEAMGPELADRIQFSRRDLGRWVPPVDRYDLVICLFVHVAGSVVDFVQGLAGGVTAGGRLVLLGHQSVPEDLGQGRERSQQVQVDLDAARTALDNGRWEIVTAAEIARERPLGGVDSVIHARRIA